MSIVTLTKNYKAATKKRSQIRQGWVKPPEGNGVFGRLAGWLPDSQSPYRITIHVLLEHYFSLTTISRNSIF